MDSLFDRLAAEFTRSVDASMQAGDYFRGKLFIELARAAIPTGSAVLDYGCGPGRLSLLLARSGFNILGADPSKGMIAEARNLDRQGLDIEFETIDQADDVLMPNAYDAIVCSSVLEYVREPHDLLLRFHHSLRKSGVLIVSYPNKSSIWRWSWQFTGPENPMEAACHHLWNWRQFRKLLLRNGFHPVVRPQFFDWPLDRHLGGLSRHIPLAGSMGVVVAKPISS
jgi:SAM-dependent methyltransferase